MKTLPPPQIHPPFFDANGEQKFSECIFHLGLGSLRRHPFSLLLHAWGSAGNPGNPRCRESPRSPPEEKLFQLLLHPGDKSFSSLFSYPTPIPIHGTFLINLTAVSKMLVALLDTASKTADHSKGQSLPQHTLPSLGEKEQSPSQVHAEELSTRFSCPPDSSTHPSKVQSKQGQCFQPKVKS